jgi:hypothetical protein
MADLSPVVRNWPRDTPAWGIPVNPALLLIPVGVLLAGFVAFCLTDLARATEVRGLPEVGMGDPLLGHRANDPVGRDRLPDIREGAVPEGGARLTAVTTKERWGLR